MNTNKKILRHDIDDWCLYLLIISILSFVLTFISKYWFGVVTENITFNIRRELYASILKKHVGWFDSKEHAPGYLN
jgi:ATP-binding cassette subfamily B (MDR/TAP) protein 1